MALSQDAVTARVLIVGKDPLIARTLGRVLGVDPEIEVIGEAETLATAPVLERRPHLVVMDAADQHGDAERARAYLDRVSPDTKLLLLETLRELSVGQMLDAVKAIASGSAERHLRLVESANDRRALTSLSERELEVVRLVAEGLSNKEISSRLSLSDKTVKNHISHILAKMNFTARTQVAVCAIRAGLV